MHDDSFLLRLYVDSRLSADDSDSILIQTVTRSSYQENRSRKLADCDLRQTRFNCPRAITKSLRDKEIYRVSGMFYFSLPNSLSIDVGKTR